MNTQTSVTIFPFQTETSTQRANEFNTNIARLRTNTLAKFAKRKKTLSFVLVQKSNAPTGQKSFRRIIIVKIGMSRNETYRKLDVAEVYGFQMNRLQHFEALNYCVGHFLFRAHCSFWISISIGFFTWQPIHQLWNRIKLSVRLQFTLKLYSLKRTIVCEIFQ